ncbi:hypothetical protein NUU61_006359 [Penicillium alfredii]|uniref:SET domain-containing protein n=1 Tax=Penicillium alfredii TaxID=1506179 RepID=A0A9W9F0Q7_9EURO|nr:uncharacterized protein NUU61_006359 [Penicillium alfredii]KAJ5091489.1 hypothetical protein NUU61_006359 [Penicillium alfredii]
MKREYLPLNSLPTWLRFYGIATYGIAVEEFGLDEHGANKGSGIIATESKLSSDSDSSPEILLQVPSDLVLSLEAVHNYAKSDQDLREVLEAVGDFARTARGAILIFLLVQITHSSPDLRSEQYPRQVGVSNPWTEYIKFLPSSFPLPTCYTDEEFGLLKSTSLLTVVDAKNTSLQREFDQIRQATESIAWCRQVWWNEQTGNLVLDDWKYVDAAYRSRMVDLPGSGHSMVPCLDMANHEAGGQAKALYDANSEGNAILRLRWGQSLSPGDEVTISYGDEKSAAEMIFSYGFLEQDRSEAKQMFLDLDIPDDDPLGVAKRNFCLETPGIRLSASREREEAFSWDSPLAWLACVNEEDGLHFGVAQTTDGGRELEASWKGEKIQSVSQLRDRLATDPFWDIFQLRAVVLLLGRLEDQLASLQETTEILSQFSADNPMMEAMFRPTVFKLLARFRPLEVSLLEVAVQELTEQRNALLDSETVTAYLTQQAEGAEQVEEVEDFS